MTKAVLKRANTLVEEYGEVIFLTLAFQPKFKRIIKQLYEKGKLDRKVKVYNFFEDLIGSKETKPKKHDIKEKGYYIFKDNHNANPSYRYYKDGLYIKYKRYNKDGILEFIDYMNASRHRYQRDEYNELGHVARSRQMDLFKNKPKLDRYFDHKGNCVLSVWLNGSGIEKRTLYFNKNSSKEYARLSDFYREWIERRTKNLRSPILVSDSRKTDELVASLSTKKIAVLHNNHLEKPYNDPSKVKKSWRVFFDNVQKFDRVVFLTEEQRTDVESIVGELDHACVIPHAASIEENTDKSSGDSRYNPRLAVTLARYTEQKRLDESINAFKYVVEELPDAEYHIYGFGPLEEELKQLINTLGLQNNIKLKGFTSNPSNIYRQAACSILTSDYEGFGMVLTESLAAGTPVVAFDVKYGPKDIIRNGIDGFVVDKGNKRKMAEMVLKIMRDTSLRNELSRNALSVLDRFSEDKYKSSWNKLFKNV